MKLFITSLLLLFLTACHHNPIITEERIVYQTVLVVPPDELLQDCELQPPPDINTYIAATWTEKEQLLTTAYDEALRKTILCTVTKKSLRSWKKEQQNIYQAKKP